MVRDFTTCHDDFNLNPPDGILQPYSFKWLGFVYYIHVTTSLAHHSISPRVVLIHNQFALGTAAELLRVPKNFKLGSIIFGDYERDEDECNLSLKQIKIGLSCPRAYFVIPYTVIIPHPEYTRFGVENSLAIIKLLRPVTSSYMLPICLPTLVERKTMRKNRTVQMIDYLSAVPLDIDIERMGKKTLKLYPFRDCMTHRMTRTHTAGFFSWKKICELGIHDFQNGNFLNHEAFKRFRGEETTHLLCTSGCGVRPGAPIINHESEGPFQLVGLSFGSEPCRTQAMRRRKNDDPPLFIDVYPYVKWITSVVSANIFPRSYTRDYMVVPIKRQRQNTPATSKPPLTTTIGQVKKKREQKWGWKGRTFVTGNYCYKSSKHQKRTAFFYAETFEARGEEARVTAFIKVSAGIETTITCARLIVPNSKHTPIIEGIGGFNITVQLATHWFPDKFSFTLGLNGKNTTKAEMSDRWANRGVGMW